MSLTVSTLQASTKIESYYRWKILLHDFNSPAAKYQAPPFTRLIGDSNTASLTALAIVRPVYRIV